MFGLFGVVEAEAAVVEALYGGAVLVRRDLWRRQVPDPVGELDPRLDPSGEVNLQ